MTTLFRPKLDGRADISLCGQYRYTLWREMRSSINAPFVAWIMLNPSTADASMDDPTIRRCISFTLDWGFSSMVVVNLFALRSPHPDVLALHRDPVGPDNNSWIANTVCPASRIVTAWGALPFARDRARSVCALLQGLDDVVCLGTNKDGSPKHPLYVASATVPKPFKPAAGAGPEAIASEGRTP